MTSDVVAVILAGGQSRRMGGGDKCLLELAGQPLIQHCMDRIMPQVAAVLINTNSDGSKYERFGLPIMADVIGDHAGPLAGVITGMAWAEREHPDARWIVSVAADTPFFPSDLVKRFVDQCQAEGTDLACAKSGDRMHPVFGLWPVRLRQNLQIAVESEGMRKVDAWTAQYQISVVEFKGETYEPFFNINTPEDFESAHSDILRRHD